MYTWHGGTQTFVTTLVSRRDTDTRNSGHRQRRFHNDDTRDTTDNDITWLIHVGRLCDRGLGFLCLLLFGPRRARISHRKNKQRSPMAGFRIGEASRPGPGSGSRCTVRVRRQRSEPPSSGGSGSGGSGLGLDLGALLRMRCGRSSLIWLGDVGAPFAIAG